MIQMAMDRTPTPAPTVVVPTLTPTLDMRPQEEIFASARQLYANQDWDNVIATIDSLRRVDVSYKAVEIDGMLYFAYRFRGIDKILHQANLEGGLYDLALSERFGPLDVDSIGYQNWARMYINGASFWQIDWIKVMQYFEQIYPYFPNMTDSSGITALERYRQAAKGQGDKLSASGDYCGAYEYYQKSLQAGPENTVAQKATEAFNKCNPATTTPSATFTPTPTTPVQATAAPTTVVTTEVPPQPTVEPQPSPEPTAGS
jgi:tetratricopeptide (TPR) repeat protein